MYARLFCPDSTSAFKEVRLSNLPVLLGRGEQVDVKLGDSWVSRQHCQLDERAGVLVVKDLGSKNGTWVNGQRVDEAEVRPGDQLGIGLTMLRADYQFSAEDVH